MKSVIIDTNLLCLLAVGRLGEDAIVRHRRLQVYGIADYELLAQVLAGFSIWVTTPHILAETSNLLRQAANPLADMAGASLAELISGSNEQIVPSVEVIEQSEYIALGVTDAAIMKLLSEGHYLISADLDLYLAAVSAGYSAINFNHLREDALLI